MSAINQAIATEMYYLLRKHVREFLVNLYKFTLWEYKSLQCQRASN